MADAALQQPTDADGPDCAGSWLHYLQMLNGLCTSGGIVSSSIRAFTTKMGIDINYNNFPDQAEWDMINQNLLAATISVQSLSPMSSYDYCRPEGINQIDRKNLIENMLSLINMQYRFCVMSCERLNNLAGNQFTKQIPGEDAEVIRPLGSLPVYNFLPVESSVMSKNLFTSPYQQRSSLTMKNSEKTIENFCWYNDPAGIDMFKFARGPGLFHDRDNSRLFSILDARSKNESKTRNFDMLPQGPTVNFLDTVRNADCAESSQKHCLSSEKNPKSTGIKNVRFDFHLPTVSTLSAAAQTAQLRRWSEAAAHEMNERQDDAGNIRRWSVPWDGGQPLLTEGKNNWHDENKSSLDTKREDQDPLEMAIVLLSYRPQHQVVMEKPNITPEAMSRRTCSLGGSSRSYSIWSGTGIIPFLQLPESQE